MKIDTREPKYETTTTQELGDALNAINGVLDAVRFMDDHPSGKVNPETQYCADPACEAIHQARQGGIENLLLELGEVLAAELSKRIGENLDEMQAVTDNLLEIMGRDWIEEGMRKHPESLNALLIKLHDKGFGTNPTQTLVMECMTEVLEENGF